MLRTNAFIALLVCLIVCQHGLAAEPTPAGVWKTIDDKTGKPRGTVRVFERSGEFFAKIESTVDPVEAAQVCDLCPGDRKNKPVMGLLIMRGMKKTDAGYGGGDILDPDTGSVYRCKMKLLDKGARLELRGFIGFSLLGRSQTWLRQE